MKHFVFLLFFLACLLPGEARAWRGFVEEVFSGKSLSVREEGSGRRVLVTLYGVEVPEPAGPGGDGQPFAEEAERFARALLPRDLPVVVHDMRRDAVGRDKGSTVTLPDGRLAQEALLAAGLAWVAPLHCGNCRHWKRLERNARKAGAGLWSDGAPVPPWEWRERGAR